MSEVNNAEYWIEKLGLMPHPEGGHFLENYRSKESIKKEHLPSRYSGNRFISTSIYFLLQKHEISAFHRLKSDETWYFHAGDSMDIYIIDQQGKLSTSTIGLNPEKGILPQKTIPKNHWFAAKTIGDFTLVGCNVAPGFDFSDFEIAKQEMLAAEFPMHKEMINRFCQAGI